MSMTYNSLITLIQQYLQRADATTLVNIPTFISLAEYGLSEILDNHLGLVQYVSGSLTPANSVIAKPARWRRSLSLRIGTGPLLNSSAQLFLRDYEFCDNYWPNRTLTAQPKFYSDYAWNNLLISPTPDIAYPFEYAYIEFIDPLSIANQTNWLTNYAPRALLYGSLLEATPYLKDDERIAVWQGFYDRAVDYLKKQEIGRYTDRTSVRESD